MPAISNLGQIVINIPAGIGRGVWMIIDSSTAALLLMVGNYGPGARSKVRSVISSQIYFTGVQAMTIIMGISTLFSAALMSVGYKSLRTLGAESHFGDLLRLAITTELGPLLTALIVVARSGTAITTELASMKINDEIDAIVVHGINPVAYLILPRIIGVWLATLILSVVFVATVYAGCILLAPPLGLDLQEVFNGLLLSLRPEDISLLAIKSSVFGLTIPMVTIHHGLRVKRDKRDLPRMGSRAVVISIILVFALDAMLSVWNLI